MQTIISSSGGVELTLSVKRDDDVFKLSLTPKLVSTKNPLGQKEDRYLIGISAQQVMPSEEDLVIKRLNPIEAAVKSIQRDLFCVCLNR